MPSKAKTSWPRSLAADLESPELESGDVSSLSRTRGVRLDSGLADGTALSGSAVASSIIVESPVDSKLPSSDLAVCSGSRARAAVGVANPSKVKSPQKSAA